MTDQPANALARRRLAVSAARRRCRASRSGWRRYTGSARLQRNRGRRGVPAGRRARGAARAARARRGRGASAIATEPQAPARARLRGRRRQAAHARRFPGQDRAAEPVGHLVRAVPQGDAGARRAAGASSAGRHFEVVAINIDTRNLDKPKAWLSEVGDRAARLLRRSEREGVPGPQGDRQGVRHADDAADRPATAASSARSPARPNGRARTRSG